VSGLSGTLPIAVLIPAYRSETFLGEALDSVLAQTQLPSEILVIDDGSPGEGTREICEARGSAVRYLRKENGGPASARNLGVAESSAEWLAFLDADDLWQPNKLERQWAALQAKPEILLICTEARLLGGSREGVLRRGGEKPALDICSLLTANPVVTSSVLLHRSAFEKAAGFCEDGSLIAVEDYDLWLRIAEQGPLLWLPEPLLEYRVHEASLSGAERFHEGVGLVLDRACQRLPAEARYRSAIRRHRATLDRDLAWELLEKGEVVRALKPIFHSLTLTPLSWRSWKLIPKALVASLKRS
jgi:glycosyltransferase involved in cell wall biosynthesis